MYCVVVPATSDVLYAWLSDCWELTWGLTQYCRGEQSLQRAELHSPAPAPKRRRPGGSRRKSQWSRMIWSMGILMVVFQIRKNMSITCRLKQNTASVVLCNELGQEPSGVHQWCQWAGRAGCCSPVGVLMQLSRRIKQELALNHHGLRWLKDLFAAYP